MYPAPWASLPHFRAHNWVRYSGEKTLAEVAQRMSEACGVQDGDILVGSSLGGMVACEITKLRRIPLLFLVGSAERKEEVSGLLATLHPLAKYVPIDWVRVSAGKIPHEFAQMFAGIESAFVRSMCTAVFDCATDCRRNKYRGEKLIRKKQLRIEPQRAFFGPVFSL